jgi:hypothetical protein
MCTPQIIQRGSASKGWRTAQLLLFLLSVPVGGCQWLLDDIDGVNDAAMLPADSGDPGEEGGSAFEEDGDAAAAQDDGARDARVEPGEHDAASIHGGTVDAAGGAGSEAGADAALDAGEAEGRDARAPIAGDAAETLDSTPPASDTSVACSAAGWWYQDGDRDGYGRSSSRVPACPAPTSGSWALEAGDCNDDDPLVHPNQPDYFDAPYRASNGSESFDYDCSGMEEGNGLQGTLASDACGLLSLLLCGGDGYLPERAGAPNPWCGSHRKAVCQAAALGLLVCEPNINEVMEPYWCR